MSCSKFFCFGDIVQGRDSRVDVTDDFLFYAVKLVMVVSDKNQNDAGKDLRNLSDDRFHSAKFTERQISKHGGAKTKLVGFRDAIELIMVLPGRTARETRAKFAGLIHRYLAGDTSLIKEIENNASSSSPITQLARATLPSESSVVEDNEARRKRIKREDAETAKLEIENVQAVMNLMNALQPGWMETDTRYRMQTIDRIKNIGCDGGSGAAVQLSVTNGEQGKALYIMDLARELKCKTLTQGEAIRVGKMAAKRYRAAHCDQEPLKQIRFVDGAERSVNCYSEADREMLTGVLADLGLLK